MHFLVSIIENIAEKYSVGVGGGGQDFPVCLLQKEQMGITLKTTELLIHSWNLLLSWHELQGLNISLIN